MSDKTNKRQHPVSKGFITEELRVGYSAVCPEKKLVEKEGLAR